MDLKVLKEFIKLAKDEGVSELKYESKDQKLSVAFGGSAVPSYQPAIMSNPASTKEQGSSPSAGNETLHEIASPFVGTFYSSSSPDKPAYIKVGDKVSKGQTLCILEAMKIMNEIESDINGEIVEICVENESLVEYGQTLFKIRA